MGRVFLCICGGLLWLSAQAWAGDADPGAIVRLAAGLNGKSEPLKSGLHWRLYSAKTETDGSHLLVDQSDLAQPSFSAPPGDYIVHVAFGLASSVKALTLNVGEQSQRLAIIAGALRINGVLGEAPIDPARLSISIFVADHNNPEAKLVYTKAHAGELVGLPEGAYHIVSTYLDATAIGAVSTKQAASTPTNSIVNADIKLPAGKIIDVTLRHRYATLTIKLVNAPGAEALANSSFTIFTPGGDPIREMIGAFPSLVLAEGEYVVVARHDSKTYQATFEVQSGQNKDVEVVAQLPSQ